MARRASTVNSLQFTAPQLVSFAMLSAVFAGLLLLSLSSLPIRGEQPSGFQRSTLPHDVLVENTGFSLNVTNCPGKHFELLLDA